MSNLNKSELLSLNGERAASHMFGEKFFRVLCCGEFPKLEDMMSIPRTEEVPVDRVVFHLRCEHCDRLLDIEFFASKTYGKISDSFESMLQKDF